MKQICRDDRSHDGELKMAIPAGMGRQIAVVLYVAAMIAVIIGLDFVFFRDRFWERLTVKPEYRSFFHYAASRSGGRFNKIWWSTTLSA
jgi:hypothetical protein